MFINLDYSSDHINLTQTVAGGQVWIAARLDASSDYVIGGFPSSLNSNLRQLVELDIPDQSIYCSIPS
jgi:hypothetical protein